MRTQAIFDDSQWQKFLGKMKSQLKDSTEILKVALMTYGFKDIDRHFKNEEGEKAKWKSRSSLTQISYANKKRAGHTMYDPANKILQLSGAMRQSILPTGIKKIGAERIKLFANCEYSNQHDEGDITRNLPMREFMWISEDAKERMRNLILNLLVGS